MGCRNGEGHCTAPVADPSPHPFPSSAAAGGSDPLPGLIANSGKLELLDRMVLRLIEQGHRVLVYSQAGGGGRRGGGQEGRGAGGEGQVGELRKACTDPTALQVLFSLLIAVHWMHALTQLHRCCSARSSPAHWTYWRTG